MLKGRAGRVVMATDRGSTSESRWFFFLTTYGLLLPARYPLIPVIGGLLLTAFAIRLYP